MAVILRNCGTWNVDNVICFLIVARGDLCDKIFEAIEKTSKTKDYRIAIHKCEYIRDILSYKPDLQVDFIIFGFDARINQRIIEVESNICLLDELFIVTGRVCFVNCSDSSNKVGLMDYTANKLRDKYCLRLLTANIYNSEGLQSLGNRIFNLSEALMGIYSGIPDLTLLSSL